MRSWLGDLEIMSFVLILFLGGEACLFHMYLFMFYCA